jgi:hypothetical protein
MAANPRFLALLEELKTSDRIPRLLDEIKELHIKKSAGYAGADSSDAFVNFRVAEVFHIPAEVGVLIRMSDKFVRAGNLITNPNNDLVGESIQDTLMDLASYALICLCLVEESMTFGYKIRTFLAGIQQSVYKTIHPKGEGEQ